MPDLSRKQKLLDKMLLDLPMDGEAMMLSELDGFLAGIVVGPALALPSEWLPMIWGGEDEDDEPVFESERQAQKLIELVMGHYNAVASDLQTGRHAPIYDYDPMHDDTLWELWISGFHTAVLLRHEEWTPLFRSEDEDVRNAFTGLMLLAQINEGECDLPAQAIEDLSEKAPDLIPFWTTILNKHRLEQAVGSKLTITHAGQPKVGRNEPCPCGSGKKYKKCCGLN